MDLADAQALSRNLAAGKLAIGQSVTRGLGAGGVPSVGRKAAEESIEDLRKYALSFLCFFVFLFLHFYCFFVFLFLHFYCFFVFLFLPFCRSFFPLVFYFYHGRST